MPAGKRLVTAVPVRDAWLATVGVELPRGTGGWRECSEQPRTLAVIMTFFPATVVRGKKAIKSKIQLMSPKVPSISPDEGYLSHPLLSLPTGHPRAPGSLGIS